MEIGLIIFLTILLILLVYELALFFRDAYIRCIKLKEAYVIAIAAGKPVLNISCGETDYGDVNADISPHNCRGFVQYDPNAPLPFNDKQFAVAFSTHTLEHCNDVQFFLDELHRVADVCIIIYPLISVAAFNPDHKWIFWDRSTKHYFRNPFYHPYIMNYPNNPFIKHYWLKTVKPYIDAHRPTTPQ